MRIVHVTMEMFKTSGVSEFCKRLSEGQAAAGHEVTLVVSHDYDNEVDGNVRVLKEQGLERLGFRPDLVQIHGLWSLFSARALSWCLANGVPYVVSPHGCMMPRVFKKGWLKKHVFWWLFLRAKVLKANLIHCTSVAEEFEVKKRLGCDVPRTVVVPLGTMLPEHYNAGVKQGPFTVLFLGRISDEKGLPVLLDAWKRVHGEGDRLIMAGPDWRGYGETLKAKIEAEGIEGVEFVGRADSDQKDELFSKANVLVLSSPMENFSLVMLEAQARAVPVIATKGTPWGDVEKHKSGWWVDYSAVAIADALKAAKALPREELRAMGERGRRLVQEKYTWGAVAKAMERAYAELVV